MEEYGDIYLTHDELKSLINAYIDQHQFLSLPMLDDLKRIIECASKIKLNDIYLGLVMDRESSIDIVEGELVVYSAGDPDDYIKIKV